ncbi:MAG TPA: gamma-glutamyltransferase [Miltoncostaeaceae bacterium]|nr:gamma-glutamyltransferase [Miltoncostaeaceae bacterium]
MPGVDLRGVVAAGHPLTARAGAEILALGGTAVDAAVAAAFAAAVAESPLTGPGGGGFLLAHPAGGPATLLDFFVTVPGLGPRGRPLRAEDLDTFTVAFGGADQVFHIGPASAAVPGMVPGLCAAAARFGRLPLSDLVGPAVRLAREGVVLGAESAYLHRILGDMLTHTPEAAAVYAPGGRLLGAGDRIHHPDLARTLEEIARGGAAVADPGGWLAEHLAAGLAARGGLITSEDVVAYRVVERTPLAVGYRDLHLLTNPPPSSGGLLIAAALGLLAASPPAGADAVAHYRNVARAGRAANRLRDARFRQGLQEEDFLEDFLARLQEGEGGTAPPEHRRPTGTTHVSVIDAAGGVASLSSSNGSGSGVMLPGTGFLLNNMLGEEDLNPDGWGTASPGARLTSMMAPSLLLRAGAPIVALGAAGSNRLRSAILQTLANIVDSGLGLRAAVARPRIHPEGDAVDVEAGVPEEACRALEEEGLRLRRWGAMNLYFGGVGVVGQAEGGLDGAGDPRRAGAAAAVTASGEVVEWTGP